VVYSAPSLLTCAIKEASVQHRCWWQQTN